MMDWNRHESICHYSCPWQFLVPKSSSKFGYVLDRCWIQWTNPQAVLLRESTDPFLSLLAWQQHRQAKINRLLTDLRFDDVTDERGTTQELPNLNAPVSVGFIEPRLPTGKKSSPYAVHPMDWEISVEFRFSQFKKW